MMPFLRNHWRSISFRLTLNYGILAILTTLILIAFLYYEVIGALRTEYTRQITASAKRLSAAYEEGGRTALAAALELTLADRIDSGREIYLLLDEKGNKIAGNLDRPPAAHDSYVGVFEGEVLQDGIPTRGHLQIQTLAGGETLVVGHDLSEMGDISAMIWQAIVAAFVLAALLVIIGTYIFRGELAYRVSHIRRTTQQIAAGQLSKRVSTAESDDEFALLNRDINSMLDRIELLMKSARHISDTIAHNLRTPLTRIVGGLRAAQQPSASPQQVLQANQRAVEEIERLSVMLEKLLQISEMQAGIQRRSFKACELHTIVGDVVEMYTTLAEDKNVSMTLTHSEPVNVHGDANLLASALANLVDNAVKYASREIRVAVFRSGQSGRVVISDDGPGVPADQYEHLGKHFYRLDPSLEGHGLGLTSVLSIVELHGGTIVFSDAQPGLSVILTLPVNSRG
ncbi:sensor histidine kinase [Bordetella sp. 02P26C-1]|uniref:sensor histidine kinase n=1 Tax=Bordetella sp. 02P26C-1 TaxID=2683195 RepID=UPI0013531536|nr:HAMP domain-containing sensor histidine kinase [Bordetella sp. 02P26C-1]MVW80122.1 HAMP domain-containing protein [Bordetella sp. 02P26C-1]